MRHFSDLSVIFSGILLNQSTGVSVCFSSLATCGKPLRSACLEHLAALIALYRPGPLKRGMVQEFLERKKGRRPAKSPFPELEPILKETYGLLVYQEQIVRIAGLLAGYALDEAYTLHKTMAQYDPASINQARERFMQGAWDSRIDQSTAEHVFEFMLEHAPYVFRKSHSIAYSMLSYRTAYLKAHYPDEFLIAKERILDCNTQAAT